MPIHVIPRAHGAPMNWLIVHTYAAIAGQDYPAGRCISLTIDCATDDHISVVTSAAGKLFDGGILGFITDSSDRHTHDLLHRDMAIAMNTNFAGTLTTFHQHWADKGASRLSTMNLANALKEFKNKGWITQPNVQAAVQFVM